MKSNRIMQIMLVAIIIVVIAAAGVLWFANHKEDQKQQDITAEIKKSNALLSKGKSERAELNRETDQLEQELADAQEALDAINFRDSAESIEYDKILFSFAHSANLQVNTLSATPSIDVTEKETGMTYSVTTFSITVEGLSPTSLFNNSQDSATYINNVVSNILIFIDTVAKSDDFDTASIESINISSPEPMTDTEVTDLAADIYRIMESELTPVEKEGKTEQEITAMLQAKLAAASADVIQELMDKAGVEKPSGVVTIEIWTYKGA